ncbi:MAG: right-handed parallel beta-helix repeat-containing protein [Prolixibacteraceae bacterium]|nr:right-handed parallel beta-helix repeat-containing protein [Prolixibacteraceae bacterium]
MKQNYEIFLKATLIFLIIFIFSFLSHGATYYVSSLGNDANSGLSESVPWKTLERVNLQVLIPGDVVRFRVGDTFYGTLKAKSSGTSSARISYEFYGSGAMPLITGFQTITGWKSLGNGIYSASTMASNNLNMVTLNGVNTKKGRYPNFGYLTFEKHSGNTSISDNELIATPNWTGAGIVVRSARWRLENKTITSHTGTNLVFPGLTITPTDGFGYFLTNDLKTLDQLGEWYCNNGTFYMYFGSNNPSNFQVKVSTLETLFEADNKGYITVNGLAFSGSNKRIINVLGSASVGNQFRYCDIKLCGGYAFEAFSNVSDLTIYRCLISDINDVGVYSWAKSTKVIGCTFSNIGLIEGMGSIEGYHGLYISGDNSMVQFNSLTNVGYNGIFIRGNNISLKNNFINSFCNVVDDGGGIYVSDQKYVNRLIDGNIILNGKGRADGTNSTMLSVEGIFLDEPVTNVVVSNNTVANCPDFGILLHEAWGITLVNNTFFNNGKGQIGLAHDSKYPAQTNIHLTNNIFFSSNTTQWCLYFYSTLDDINFGSSNGNVFARPLKDQTTIYTKTASTSGAFRDLNSWRLFTGYDANSTKSPISLTNSNDITLEYNATSIIKTIILTYPVIDARGVKYSGSISLQPYTSLVLMKDPSPTVLKSAFITPMGTNNNFSQEVIGVELFPNPSHGKVNVRFLSLPSVGSRIEIFDVTGRIVASRLISGTSEVFDLSNQNAGLYVLKSTLGSQIFTNKLIITK